MTAPVYAEFAPRESLRDFVYCIWTFTGPADDAEQRIAPDGRPELILHHGTRYIEHATGGAVVQPRVLFAGQLTQPLILTAPGPAAVVGVRLHAFAARAFLGQSADAVTDRRVDAAALFGAAGEELARGVLAAADVAAVAELAQDFAAMRFNDAALDQDVRAFVEALAGGGEAAAPDVSERQWQRRFKTEVGVSPRMLQSVLRFRRVFDAIEHPETSGWVEAALSAGYFDQPQMARDFRRFLGCTARAWAAQKAGLARSLAAAPDSYKN